VFRDIIAFLLNFFIYFYQSHYNFQQSILSSKHMKRIKSSNEIGLESVEVVKKNTEEFVTTYNLWYQEQ
jgi:YbbR domain-containing protein